MPDKIDGDIYVRNLAAFVRTNEKQLANPRRSTKNSSIVSRLSGQWPNLSSSPSSPSSNSKALRLSLTPHHLFYLLYRFKSIGLSVGPTSIRLEVLKENSSPKNYVSFLNDKQASSRSKLGGDSESLGSATSVQTTMSTFSSIFNRTAFNKERARRTAEQDLIYLYSAFTKLPALRLTQDPKSKVIEGFEEFPFDRAVPLTPFKNISSLELVDIDVRAFYGWNAVSERLKTLIVRNGMLDDPIELICALVLDDMDRRRRRTSTSIPVYAVAANVSDNMMQQPPDISQLLLARVTSGRNGRRSSRSPSRSRSHSRSKSLDNQNAVDTRLRSDSLSSVFSTASSTSQQCGSSSTTLTALNWHLLRVLSLADNGISSVSSESMEPLAESLVSLDLSNNMLFSIPEALSRLSRLSSLNISYNQIVSLHSLSHYPLPAITILNLRGNKITSLVGLDRILSLERVDLRDNALTDPTELARLTSAPNIQDIWVAGNPFVSTYSSNYRVTIFNLFRATPGYTDDIVLDDTPPGLLEQRQLIDRVQEYVVPTSLASYEIVTETSEKIASRDKRKEEDDIEKTLPMIRTFNIVTSKSKSPSKHKSKSRSSSRAISPSSITSRKSETSTMSVNRPSSNTVPIKVVNPNPRKPMRRRVVDLDDNAGNLLNGDYTIEYDKMSTRTVDSSRSKSPAPSTKSPPRISSPPMSSSGEKNWSKQGEEYRKRIEALRNDFGSGWLSVLSEEL
ncbi:hypothetical protein V1511DRAFT_456491 [Dipodascopsis uninucleata]